MSEHPVVTAAREAGLVGRGGAGFPTHVKLAARAEILIANGCECEPLLASDHALMERDADKLLRGLAAAVGAVGAQRGIIALKRKHTQLIADLRARVAGTPWELFLLDDFYPAGDEQVLVREITGRSVPPLGLPSAVGCVVSNVATLADLAEALDGHAVTRRLVTVSGAVREPIVLDVPVGTAVNACIERAVPALADYVVVLGGPMMGTVLDTEASIDAAVVSKTVSGILLLPRGHHVHKTARQDPRVMRRRAAAACIQCRFCSDLCPRTLIGHPFETHEIMRDFGIGKELEPRSRQALMCCACGICEHVACPMELSPCAVNALIKAQLAAQKLTYDGDRALREQAASLRDYRKVPVSRLAARIGISAYMHLHPAWCGRLDPDTVRVPLQQHIGAPASPVRSVGDTVRAGELLAEIPHGKLGARVHASISGTITGIDAAVSIRSERV